MMTKSHDMNTPLPTPQPDQTPVEPLLEPQPEDSNTPSPVVISTGDQILSPGENDGVLSPPNLEEPVKKAIHPKGRFSQAEKILAKFGGARRLSELFKAMGRPRNPATIYKWTYSREGGGTDGLIPSCAWADVLHAARLEGILIQPDDLNPAPRDVGEL